jgi:hypothetical protein
MPAGVCFKGKRPRVRQAGVLPTKAMSPPAMKVTILDDYFDTVRTLPCFAKLAAFDVTVWNDHSDDVDVRRCARRFWRGCRGSS